MGLFEKGTMMGNEQDKNPTTGQESDISKSQATRQPTDEQGKPSEFDQDTAPGQPDEGLQGETATEQRSDIEGTSQQPEKGEAESGFVGSQGEQDTSSELVDEDDKDLAKGDGE